VIAHDLSRSVSCYPVETGRDRPEAAVAEHFQIPCQGSATGRIGLGYVAEYALFGMGLLLFPTTIVILCIAAFRRSRRLAIVGGACLVIMLVAFARVRYGQFWAYETCLDDGYRCEEAGISSHL